MQTENTQEVTVETITTDTATNTTPTPTVEEVSPVEAVKCTLRKTAIYQTLLYLRTKLVEVGFDKKLVEFILLTYSDNARELLEAPYDKEKQKDIAVFAFETKVIYGTVMEDFGFEELFKSQLIRNVA